MARALHRKAEETTDGGMRSAGEEKDGSIILVDRAAVEGCVRKIRTIGTQVDLVLNPIAPVDGNDAGPSS